MFRNREPIFGKTIVRTGTHACSYKTAYTVGLLTDYTSWQRTSRCV